MLTLSKVFWDQATYDGNIIDTIKKNQDITQKELFDDLEVIYSYKKFLSQLNKNVNLMRVGST